MGDPILVLVGKRCHIVAILVSIQIVMYGPVLKARMKVRPISGKLGTPSLEIYTSDIY